MFVFYIFIRLVFANLQVVNVKRYAQNCHLGWGGGVINNNTFKLVVVILTKTQIRDDFLNITIRVGGINH